MRLGRAAAAPGRHSETGQGGQETPTTRLAFRAGDRVAGVDPAFLATLDGPPRPSVPYMTGRHVRPTVANAPGVVVGLRQARPMVAALVAGTAVTETVLAVAVLGLGQGDGPAEATPSGGRRPHSRHGVPKTATGRVRPSHAAGPDVNGARPADAAVGLVAVGGVVPVGPRLGRRPRRPVTQTPSTPLAVVLDTDVVGVVRPAP